MIEEFLNQHGDYSQDKYFKDLTTVKMGGHIKHFVLPNSVDDLKAIIDYLKTNKIPFKVIGNGSNLICGESEFDGVVICLKKLNSFEISNDEIYVEAGVMAPALANILAKQGLSCLEFASGIPGTMGGLIYMNAGAYGREMKDIVTQVTYLDTETMTIEKLSNEQCEFGYRTSAVEKKGGIVISARMKMAKGDAEQIKNYVAELREKRTTSQPLEVPSAGSTFKRPEGFFAGKLIQDAGLKGITIDHSGAQVSPKHAGFVVNNGGTATATDIYRLIQYVITKVFENSGVHLEPEVRLIGFDKDK